MDFASANPALIPAQRVGALSGALTAAGYCALAGFDVPAQRTLIMIIVVAVNLWRARRVRSLDTLLTALLLVLIFDPLAVTEVGFWLSFVAVLVLIYATGEIVAASGFWRQCIYVHWAIAVGIAPLLAYFFATIPLVGPPANLFAVPWVSFVVVPLTLLGTFVQPWLPFLGYWFLRGALLALELLWVPLQWLAQLPHATVATPHPNVAALACAAVGALVALMPAGLPARTLALVWFAPLFLCSPPRPQAGEFELTVLDVGQGLSAVVLMREHVLVFDTGPAFSERFDAGSAVVVPFLRHHGITHVDALVVSHGDNDHIGGAASLFKAMDVMRTLSSVPQKIQHGKVETCMQGQQWTWDGVVFHMLGPASDARLTGNDASCVLKVQNRSGERSVLLTGDIEAVGERSLLSSGAGLLSSTLVVAPHHGSATSSTDAFVAATRPQLLAFAVGYKNRWRFPNPDVVNRWRSAGAQQFRTDEDGAISWNSEAGIQLQRFRRDHRHYWRAATQVQSEVGNQR
ncbi:MAG: DNA internalization-related competence protein ComEC/Rec2 [Gammaproteobacteria bacterium]